MPALALAGAMVVGAAVAGMGMAPGAAGLAAAAGAAALARGARRTWRSPWTLGFLGVLAVASAGRALDAVRGAGDLGRGALVSSSRRPPRDPGRMALVAAGTGATIECARGAACPRDVVRVLGGVTPRRRAVGCLPGGGDGDGVPLPAGRGPLPPRLLADDLARLAAGPGGGERPGPLPALRRRGIQRATAHADPRTGGLLAALLFGETGHLEPGMADLFTRTGTRHMLALSGLHVGLIAVMVALPLGTAIAGLIDLVLAAVAALLGRPRPTPLGAGVIAALLAVGFIPLAGYGAPAARAAVALALGWLAPRRGMGIARRPLGLNLLGVALAVECVVDPLAPLRTGVQLSYGATVALITLGPAAAARAWDRVGRVLGLEDGRISAVDRFGRRRWALGRAALERGLRGLVAGVAASVVATLATLPVVWSTFGECAPVGIVATPLLLPLLAVLIAAGFAFVVLPDGSAPGLWAATLAEGAGAAMVDGLSWLDAAPWTPLALPPRSAPLAAAAAVLGLVRVAGLGPRPLARAAGFGFVLGMAALLRGGVVPPAERLQVLVADVGNGTGVLVRAPGAPVVVFDAGSRDRVGVASDALGPMLRALGPAPVDVVLTHDHADHSGGLPWLARRFGVRRWIGPLPAGREGAGLGPAPWAGAEHIRPGPGLTTLERHGSALDLRVLRGGAFPGNEGSLTLDVRWRGARVVLSGDAEGHGLAAMLRGLPGRPPAMEAGPVDALLLPHHGSSSRHLGWLLDRLRPAEVWVSASEVAPVLARECQRRGIRLRATASGGPFTWTAHNPLVTGPDGPDR